MNENIREFSEHGLLFPHKVYPYYVNKALEGSENNVPVNNVVLGGYGLGMSYLMNDHVYGDDPDNGITGKMYGAQGMTYLDDNRVVFALRDADETKVILKCADVETYTLLPQAGPFPYGHANSLTYDGTYIYIVPISHLIYVTRDYRVEGEPYTCTREYGALAYDKVRKNFIARWSTSTELYFYEVHFDHENKRCIEDRFLCKVKRPTPISQSFDVLDGIMYDVRSAPSCICMYDLDNGAFVGVYNVSSTNHGFMVGEMEDLSYDMERGYFYLYSTGRYNDQPTSLGNRKMLVFHKFGIVADDDVYSYISGSGDDWGSTIDSTRHIYADSSTTSLRQIGNQRYPFKWLGDALGFIEMNNERSRYDVYVKGRHTGNRIQSTKNTWLHMTEGSYSDRVMVGYGGTMWIDQSGTIDYVYCWGNNVVTTNENLHINRFEAERNCVLTLFHHGNVGYIKNSIVRTGASVGTINYEACLFHGASTPTISTETSHTDQVAWMSVTGTPKFAGWMSGHYVYTTNSLNNPDPNVFELFYVDGRVNGRIIEDMNNVPSGQFRGIVYWIKRGE